jgi:polysaccharide biosynthesis/export protein
MRRFGQSCSSCYRKIITFKFFLFASVVCWFFSACTATKTSYYFKQLKKDTSISVFVDTNLNVRIHSGDVISILVSSLDKTEDLLFNTQEYIGGFTGGAYVSSASLYIVDSQGNIQMHKLGLINVEEMTLNEVKKKLEEELLPYLRDPIVTLSFSNHKVIIMGQVVKPQTIQLTTQSLSIIEALVLSGDITPNADMKNVLVIRENNNIKQFRHVNLENPSFIDSSWYYLKANDIVYVNTDFERVKQQVRRTDIQQNIGIFTSILSLILIVTGLIK